MSGRTISFLIAALVAMLSCAAPILRGQSSGVAAVTDKIYTYHLVYAPKGYSVPLPVKKDLGRGDISIDIYARRFAQGETLYAEICPKVQCSGEFSVTGASFGTTSVLLSKRPWGYRGIIPVHGDHVPGKTVFTVQYFACGSQKKATAEVMIEKTNFQFYKQPLDLGKYSNVDYQLKPDVVAFIQRCAEKKRKVFGTKSPDYLGQTLSHPRDIHHITSPFWSKRVYMQYRYKSKHKVMLGNKVRVHGGLDLRGNKGDPVYAIADGLVAIAENMYYEGNFVVIDHGNRMFTYYMHMNGILVKEGDMVKGGDKVGLVGSTGISTAAHLHVSLIIQGVQVDPISLLPLPIRN